MFSCASAAAEGTADNLSPAPQTQPQRTVSQSPSLAAQLCQAPPEPLPIHHSLHQRPPSLSWWRSPRSHLWTPLHRCTPAVIPHPHSTAQLLPSVNLCNSDTAVPVLHIDPPAPVPTRLNGHACELLCPSSSLMNEALCRPHRPTPSVSCGTLTRVSPRYLFPTSRSASRCDPPPSPPPSPTPSSSRQRQRRAPAAAAVTPPPAPLSPPFPVLLLAFVSSSPSHSVHSACPSPPPPLLTSSSFLHSLGARLQGLRGKDASRCSLPHFRLTPIPRPPSGFDAFQAATALPSPSPRPLAVLLACGSYSPPTSMHLLLFESARNHLIPTPPLPSSTSSAASSPLSTTPTENPPSSPPITAWRCAAHATSSSPWVTTSAWETLQGGWEHHRLQCMAAYSVLHRRRAYPHGPVRHAAAVRRRHAGVDAGAGSVGGRGRGHHPGGGTGWRSSREWGWTCRRSSRPTRKLKQARGRASTSCRRGWSTTSAPRWCGG